MNVFMASGRIGKDAETRFTTAGMPVTTFSMAVDQGFGDKKKAMWLRCKVFKRENLAPHLLKGKPIIVRGELTINEWEKDGQKHSMPEIICNEVEFQQGQPRDTSAPASPAPREGQFPSEASGMEDVPFAVVLAPLAAIGLALLGYGVVI